MKLFTPVEVLTTKEKQTEINLKRAITVDSALEVKRKLLNDIQLETDIALARQANVLAEEKEAQSVKIRELKSEVINLEQRKKEALIPITAKWQELEEYNSKVKAEKLEIDMLRVKYQVNLELLEEKLSEVGERELNVIDNEKRQKIAQWGIESQKEVITNQSKELNRRLAEYQASTEAREIDLTTKQTKLALKEQELETKEKELKNIEKGFIDRERSLQDRYATLERTTQRFNASEKR